MPDNSRWNVWLLNDGEEPLLWMSNLTSAEARRWAQRAADKVSDGSDADAFLLCRTGVVDFSVFLGDGS